MNEPSRPVWIGSLLWPKVLRGHRMSLAQGVTRLVFLLIGVAIAVGIYQASLWLLTICYEVEAIGPLLCRRLTALPGASRDRRHSTGSRP